jgi:ubiquinone/menaquinone biosynthesis C-methylase UbiE
MSLFATNHKQYWRDRKIDWVKSYSSTYNHPHRLLIVDVLKRFVWTSLMEIGCASGPNLLVLKRFFPRADLGGIDINKDAIAVAKQTFDGMGFFLEVGDSEDILMSDRSCDVVLADMTLMYLNRRQARRALTEMFRIARKRIVLVELHSANPMKRALLRLSSGYYAHNYKKMLSKIGFYDILIRKITQDEWPGGKPQKSFAYIISAKKV